MKQTRWTMNYDDVIEAKSEWLLGTAPKVKRNREAMCVTEATGESERVSTPLSPQMLPLLLFSVWR